MIEAVASGILTIHELRMPDYLKDDTVQCACYSIYYLVTEVCKEYGISKQEVVRYFIDVGYEPSLANYIVDNYETWAQKIVVKETKRSLEGC